MSRKKKSEKLLDVLDKVRKCIIEGNYILSTHALARQDERKIDVPSTLYVLETGYEEKRKTCFDIGYNSWKYAIRGKTIDDLDIRVIVAFDENQMLIITVMHVL